MHVNRYIYKYIYTRSLKVSLPKSVQLPIATGVFVPGFRALVAPRAVFASVVHALWSPWGLSLCYPFVNMSPSGGITFFHSAPAVVAT